MLIQLLLSMIISGLGIIFQFLPVVTKLPNIAGYDIDTALVSGVGMLYRFTSVVWPVGIVIQGFLFLMVYYSIKVILKFFLGHRAPGATQ